MLFIKDLISSPVISIDAQEAVEPAAKLMVEKKVSSLIVMQEGEHVGIVIKTDLVKRILANGLNSKTTSIGI
jgi:CBS domain-containing protein